MTSLRNHRVIIASLFLPTTAVLGESNPPTPSIPAQDPDPPRTGPPFRHRHSGSLGGNQPLKSIVEDLKVCPLTRPFAPDQHRLVSHRNTPHRRREQPLLQVCQHRQPAAKWRKCRRASTHAQPRPLVHLFVQAAQVPDDTHRRAAHRPSPAQTVSLLLASSRRRLPVPSRRRLPPLAHRAELALQRWPQKRRRQRQGPSHPETLGRHPWEQHG
jgi:hypothetical protein